MWFVILIKIVVLNFYWIIFWKLKILNLFLNFKLNNIIVRICLFLVIICNLENKKINLIYVNFFVFIYWFYDINI